MGPAIAGPLIGGAAGLLGDIFGFASAKNLSSTAHQREVEDLRKAGLNPVLSAMGGPGASTPNVGDFSGASEGFNSARRISAEVGLLKEQTRKASYEADVVNRTGIPLAESHRDMNVASARAAMAGVPWKEAVGTVATDARQLYQKGQKFIRRGIDDFKNLSPRRMPGRGRIPAFRRPN